jgi:hypothetical protein
MDGKPTSRMRRRRAYARRHDIGRTRKDGSNAFVAQIVIKKLVQSSTARRRLLTASKLANVWIVKREAARAARRHCLAYCAD